MKPVNHISRQTARRYVLGRQGLYPGRRFSGKEGTKSAILQSEVIQVDTINVIARNHDLVLHSRVQDYDPQFLDDLMYRERQFFDFGAILFVLPTHELPFWRTIMQYWQPQLLNYLSEHATTVEHVRAELRNRGALANRDFVERQRIPGGFRTIKDTGKVLYYLWLTGEIVTHSRKRFERLHDFFENVFQPVEPATLEETERHIGLKIMREVGLATASEWAKRAYPFYYPYWKPRPNPKEVQKWLDNRVAEGELAKVEVEGRKLPCYLPAADLNYLEILESGAIPAEWKPLDKATDEEVNFIAPLDNVIWDRARTLALFEFDYIWEVYKPAPTRRWGYYTMPILYGDRFVGRIDPKLDRKNSTLKIEGFWLDDETLRYDERFNTALQTAFNRFACFHQATLVTNYQLGGERT
jgi:hypothetical protein